MPMKETKYRYSIYDTTDYDHAIKLRVYDWQNIDCDFSYDSDIEELAETCAEHYYRNHDGYEHSSWSDGSAPLTFYIWEDETTKVAYDVYLEYEPTFSARKSK